MPNINLYEVMFKVWSSGCKLNKFESSLETNVGAAKFYELRVFSLLQAKGRTYNIVTFSGTKLCNFKITE